jgi:hypothetical protein
LVQTGSVRTGSVQTGSVRTGSIRFESEKRGEKKERCDRNEARVDGGRVGKREKKWKGHGFDAEGEGG